MFDQNTVLIIWVENISICSGACLFIFSLCVFCDVLNFNTTKIISLLLFMLFASCWRNYSLLGFHKYILPCLILEVEWFYHLKIKYLIYVQSIFPFCEKVIYLSKWMVDCLNTLCWKVHCFSLDLQFSSATYQVPISLWECFKFPMFISILILMVVITVAL